MLAFDDVVGSDLGQRVVVLGSNAQAVDVAVYLAAQGKDVTIVTPDPLELFEKGHSVNVRGFVETALNAQGTRVWPSATLSAVGDGTVSFTSEAGVDVTVPCDALVDMRDMLPDTALADALAGVETVAVGDCADPYNIAEAIAAGNLAARAL